MNVSGTTLRGGPSDSSAFVRMRQLRNGVSEQKGKDYTLHSQIDVICAAADWHMSKDLRVSDSLVPFEACRLL
jgi:hypothetical protein